MHRTGLCLSTLLAATLAPAQPTPELPSLLINTFGEDALWDDGRAEVAHYRASRIIYGKARPHTVVLLTVAEDFTTEYYVKADWPHGQKPILPVIKQNFIAQIETDNYPYHFMTSTFFPRAKVGNAVKLSVTSTEWCGITHKEFQLWRDKPTMLYSSYWDGEGTGTRELPGDLSDFFEEELFFSLRALPFAEGLTATFWLYPTQTTIRAPEPKPVLAQLSVADGNDGWQVVVQANDNRELRYRFAKTPPHLLQEFRHSDGRTMELERVERDAYWIIEE